MEPHNKFTFDIYCIIFGFADANSGCWCESNTKKDVESNRRHNFSTYCRRLDKNNNNIPKPIAAHPTLSFEYIFRRHRRSRCFVRGFARIWTLRHWFQFDCVTHLNILKLRLMTLQALDTCTYFDCITMYRSDREKNEKKKQMHTAKSKWTAHIPTKSFIIWFWNVSSVGHVCVICLKMICGVELHVVSSPCDSVMNESTPSHGEGIIFHTHVCAKCREIELCRHPALCLNNKLCEHKSRLSFVIVVGAVVVIPHVPPFHRLPAPMPPYTKTNRNKKKSIAKNIHNSAGVGICLRLLLGTEKIEVIKPRKRSIWFLHRCRTFALYICALRWRWRRRLAIKPQREWLEFSAWNWHTSTPTCRFCQWMAFVAHIRTRCGVCRVTAFSAVNLVQMIMIESISNDWRDYINHNRIVRFVRGTWCVPHSSLQPSPQMDSMQGGGRMIGATYSQTIK